MRRELAPGGRVDRYEMVTPIGEGGMATVWVARQHGKHGFQKIVAFKSILTRYAENANFRAMLLDEARIASHIEHPSVCQILDVGEEGDLLYLVLEYVDGDALSSIHYHLSQLGQTFPLPIALKIGEEVCAGLHAAHELRDAEGHLLGVVHRDVSPQNVLLGVRGDVKVIDFGIALARDRMTEETSHGSLKGKVNYMPPEQARAEKVDRTADVWSVGAMVYKLIAGRSPYQGPSDAATLTRLLSGAPPDPLPEGTPAIVGQVLAQALAEERTQRFPTAATMQAALAEARRSLGVDVSREELGAFTRANLSARAEKLRRELKSAVAELGPDSRAQVGVPELSLPSQYRRAAEAEPALEAPAAAEPPEVSLSAVGGALEPSIPEVSLSSVGTIDKTDHADGPIIGMTSRMPPSDPPPSSVPQPPPARSPARAGAGGPAFMDVRALIRSEGDPTPAIPRTNDIDDPPRRGPVVISAAPALTALEPEPLPAAGPDADIPLELAATPRNWKKTVEKRPIRWKPWVFGGASLAVVVAFVALGVPEIAKRRVVLAAAERGVELTIGRATLTTQGVELSEIGIKFPNVAGLTGTVKEFRADLTGDTLTVTDLDLVADSPSDKLLRDLESLKQRTGASSLRRVQLRGLHVTWKKPPGPLTQVEMSGGSFELGTRQSFGDDLKGSFQKVLLSSSEGTVGPWAIYVDQDRELRRYRLVFDPPVPDGPHLTWSTGTSVDHVAMKIPRSPLARFGIPPKLVGVEGAEAPDVEADVSGTYKPATRLLELDVKLGVFGLRTPKGLLDLKANATFAGDPAKPVPMTKGQAELGAFTAELGGSLTVEQASLRVDTSFRTTAMTCERLARLQSEKTLGTFGPWFVGFVRASGLATVTGTLNVQGTFAFDTRTPKDPRLTWTTKETCGLRLLP